MKKTRNLLLAAVMGSLIAAPTAAFATHLYTDVPDDSIYAGAVERLSQAGVVKGCTTTAYCPNTNVTRGQMALLLDRMSGNGDVAPSVDAATVMGMTPEQLRGAKGDTGPAGATGAAGAAGPAGPKGDIGETGPQGVPGQKGDTGETGPQGVPGQKGDTGETGPQGVPGQKGDTGDTGPAGANGTSNPTVVTGNLRNSGTGSGTHCGSPSGLSTAIPCPTFAAVQPVAGLLPVSGSFSNLTVRLDTTSTTDTTVFLQADISNTAFIRCTVPAGTRTCTSGSTTSFAPAASNIYIGANSAPGSFSFGYTFQPGPL